MKDKYPRDKFCEDDEGALMIGVTVKDKTIIIDFGEPIKCIGMDKQTALALANLIILRSEEIG